VNKLDLEATRRWQGRNRRKDVLFISALIGAGVPELTTAIVKTLAAAPEPPIAVLGQAIKLRARQGQDLAVEKLPSGFVLRGTRVERLVERTDLESEAALARFQGELDRLGVNRALEAAGAQPGDSVRISGVEFEYQP